MERAIPDYLLGFERVMSAFGYWPALHDAHVRFVRTPTPEDASVELLIHGFEMTSEVDARGHFVLTKHHLIRLVFAGVTDARLGAPPTDTLDRLELPSAPSPDGTFEVHLHSAIDGSYDGRFTATRGEVASVTPCAPDYRV